jgi:hypothetical protein
MGMVGKGGRRCSLVVRRSALVAAIILGGVSGAVA